MTPSEFGACIHPREHPRFFLALLFALPIALAAIGVTLVTFGLVLAIVLWLAFFVWLMFEIVYATLIANWILVSEHNYPRLNALLEETRARIRVKERIDIIVYEQGNFNAYFSMLFARRAIFLNSELLEQGVSDDELRWLIARFVGRIRAKRRMGPMRWVIALAEKLGVFNLFIFPYERATAYTGDRVALAVIDGDITTAISAMNKLMVGRQLGYSVNPAGIVTQYKRVKGSLFAFLGRLASPLPATTARYFDLIVFAQERYPDQYAQFAAMNPSFQTAGGAWQLMRNAEQPSYAGQGMSSGTVGALLFFGALSLGVVGSGLAAVVYNGGFGSFMQSSDYAAPEEMAAEESYPATDYTAPAAEDPYAYVEAPADPYAAAPAAGVFGAYSVSNSTLAWGVSWNAATREEAERAAIDTCAQSDCRSVGWLEHSCGALAMSSDRAWAVDWASTAEEASQKALTACRNFGGTSCVIQNATCSPQ